MLHMTTYRLKPFATKAERVKVMELFAKHGTTPGTLGHWVSADATVGWLISNDEVAEVFKKILVYVEYLEYEVRPALPIEEAAPLILEAIK